MDEIPFPFLPVVVFAGLMGVMQIAWYIAVLVFLYKIWQKVKHLPG